MWQLIALVLAIVTIVSIARYQQLKRELSCMAQDMAAIHNEHGNRQLTIGTQVPQLAQLAIEVNAIYDDVEANKANHRASIDEMRQSMANISHDLRTPLTSVLGYLKLLRDGNNTIEQQQRYLDVAYGKAVSLNRLVSGLFELARLETGGYVFEHQKLDATALLGEELAGVYAQLSEKGTLSVDLPEHPLWVIGDKDALSRIFANLLQNMIKHGQNPMSVEGCVEGKETVFRFSNGASGLSEADASQLFHRFFTADRMRSGENTGLGLSIVKEFTEQMNGTIHTRLHDGILTFTLRWPV